jgi:regulator of sigma E protease
MEDRDFSTKICASDGDESLILKWLPQPSDGTTVLVDARVFGRCMDYLFIFLNFLYVAAAVIFLFGAAVFVHEWGHFFVARKCGMKVEAFAVGFGPKIVSWVRDGIEYSLRWIPAGGFVKLPQMITSEALEGSNKAESIPPAPPISRILVAIAGPAMNVVFAFVIASLIYFVGLPMLVNPSYIGYVDPESAEAKLGIKAGDRVVEVNGRRVTTWQQINEITALARTNVLPVVVDHAGQRKTYQLQTKTSELLGGVKFLNLDPQEHPAVLNTLSGSAAEAAGLQRNDVLISFSGVPVSGKEQLIELVQKRADQPTELVIERGPAKERITVTVTPKYDASQKRALIGINFANASHYEVQKPGPTPLDQVSEVWNRTIGIFSALLHPKQTGIGAKDLSGPIGIAAVLSYYVHTDYRLALSFLVLLNINLAILNLMPMPVLDGGHIVMALIESIFRRPLPVKVQEYMTTAFAVVLISLMVYVSYHDLGRIPLFKSMFQQETQIGEKGATAPANNK